MRNKIRLIMTSASALAIATVMGITITPSALAAEDMASTLEEGKALSWNRKKGNCLACHRITGKDLEGTLGPPLIAMKARFTKEALKAQIVDARTENPNTIMPPFGAHAIMSDKEIDKVVEYILSL